MRALLRWKSVRDIPSPFNKVISAKRAGYPASSASHIANRGSRRVVAIGRQGEKWVPTPGRKGLALRLNQSNKLSTSFTPSGVFLFASKMPAIRPKYLAKGGSRMKSKHLISYSIDSLTNLIGYDSQQERDGAYRQYTEIGILIVHGIATRPDHICAMDVLSCAAFKAVH